MGLAKSAVDWGSVPDWVAAVGGAISLFVVVIGLLYEIRRRRLDDERAAAERRDAEARQARLVTFDWSPTETDHDVQVSIRNDGDGPIRHVTVWAHLMLFAWDVEGKGSTRPEYQDICLYGEDHDEDLRYVAPQSRREWVLSYNRTKVPPGEVSLSELRVEFTDAAGLRWARTGDDEPRRLFK